MGLLNYEGGDVAKRIPTQLGDVLLLTTEETFIVYAVGQVTRDGQQEFEAHMDVRHHSDRADAVADAKSLVMPGRRVFCRNIDTNAWSEI